MAKMSSATLSAEEVNLLQGNLGYVFHVPAHLQEALDLTKPSRLQFLGEAALKLMISTDTSEHYALNKSFLACITTANLFDEKLARNAIRLGLHRCIRHDSPGLDKEIKEFVEESELNCCQVERQILNDSKTTLVSKVLAETLHAIAGAIFLDCNTDMTKFSQVMKPHLEPKICLKDLMKSVTTLNKLCEIHDMKLEYKHTKIDDDDGEEVNTMSVFVKGKILGSSSSGEEDVAKFMAAADVLRMLPSSMLCGHCGGRWVNTLKMVFKSP